MSKTKWYARPIYLVVALALVLSLGIVALPMAGTVEAHPGTIQVDVNDASCVASPQGDPYSVVYCSIQDAIDDATAGDTINVAAGTYNLTAPIVVNKSVTLISDTGNYRTTGTILTGKMRIILADSASSATIQGFRFENIASDVEFVSICANSITIQANSFNNIVSCGAIILSRYGSENTIIQDNSFKDIVGHAVAMYSGCNDTGWHIIGNKIDGVTGTGNKSGFQLFGLSDSEISNNEISNCTIYAGMLLDGLDNVVISDNIIKNTYRKGIQVANSSDVVIDNNYITNTNTSEKPDEGAISIYPDVSNIRIVNNTLVANYQGFTVRDKAGAVASDVHVNFNNIYGNDGFGTGNFAKGGGMVDATCNWWGAADGPSEQGSGSGDAVSTNVEFAPWLTGPFSMFHIDHAKMDFKKKPNDDKVDVRGRLGSSLTCGRDVQSLELVTVTVGPLSDTITMELKGKEGEKWEYKRPKDDGGIIKHMTINWKNGKFDIRMDKADLTGVTNPVTISIQIGDDLGQETITMNEKKHHWDYKAPHPAPHPKKSA